MARIEVVAPPESVEALSSRLRADPKVFARVSQAVPYRPGLTERIPLGHVELVRAFVDFLDGVAAAAAYDLVKRALDGIPVHRIREDDAPAYDESDDEPEDK